MSDKNYGKLCVSLPKYKNDRSIRGLFLNDKMYITASVVKNKIRLFFIKQEDDGNILTRFTPESDVQNIDDELLNKVLLHEHYQQNEQERKQKENKSFKKSARQIYK